MALTKPKLSTNINTDSSVFADPILVLHQGSGVADVDVGFLMNRSNGLTANAAVIWQESSKSFVHILTDSSGAPDSNLTVQSYANVSVGNVLLINNAGIYVDGTLGSAGQVLASDGAKTFWAPPGGFTGGIVVNPSVFQSNLVISNTTASTSTVTGALVVLGGVGVDGNLNILNTGDVSANIGTLFLGNASTNANLGAFQTYANTKIGTNTNSNLVVVATTTSTSTTTGALVVLGGAGIGGNIVANAVYTATGVYWSGNGEAFTSTTIANTEEITANLSSGQNVGLLLTTTGVAAGNYGSATSIPTIVVDNKGRLTSVTSNVVSTTINLTGDSGSGNVAGGGTLTVNGTTNQITTSVSASTITIALAQDVTAPGNLTVAGNLVVQGNTTTLNTETLTIEDLNITVANGAVNAAAADGAGITVGGANARLLYKSATDSWVFDRSVFASGNLVANSGTTSSSTTTGAIVVTGGVGIGGNLNILNTGDVSANIGTLFLGNTSTNANLGAYQTYANANAATQATSINTFNANLGAYQTYANTKIGTNTNSNLVVAAATTSTSTTTGALVVGGGVGISGALYTGGIIDATGNIIANSGTTSTSTTTGALVVVGGMGISNDIVAGGAIIPGTDNTGFIGNATNTWANGQFTNLTIDSVLSVRGAVDLADNDILRFGSSDDWEFFHDGTDNFIDLNVGDLRIRDNTTQRASFARTTGNLVLDSTTTSTSTTTGALVVAGGIGVAGNIFVANTKIGTWNGGAAYRGIYQAGMSGSEYGLIMGDTDKNTYISSWTGGAVNIRGGNNTSTFQISVSPTAITVTGNLTTNGWIIPSSNVSQNLGTTTAWWNTFYGVSTQARYADLAENYQADNNYEPGTVLVFGGIMEVTISTVSHDAAVAGVVSTNPAHLMNGALQGSDVVALALQGRVPCQVRGPVSKGTVLVTSDVPGVAEALVNSLFNPGCVLGKSLESIVDNSIKTIEVVVGRF